MTPHFLTFLVRLGFGDQVWLNRIVDQSGLEAGDRHPGPMPL